MGLHDHEKVTPFGLVLFLNLSSHRTSKSKASGKWVVVNGFVSQKSSAWNAKCLFFLGNFTPKTSDFCLKNRALGVPDGIKWKLGQDEPHVGGIFCFHGLI